MDKENLKDRVQMLKFECQKEKLKEKEVQMIKFRFQATLHVGDEIREINGISVANQVKYYDDGGISFVNL